MCLSFELSERAAFFVGEISSYFECGVAGWKSNFRMDYLSVKILKASLKYERIKFISFSILAGFKISDCYHFYCVFNGIRYFLNL